MDIFITMNDFPTKLIPQFKVDLRKQGIKAEVIERPSGTVMFSCTVEDVVKGQIAVIIADKYRFMKEGDSIGEEEAEALQLPHGH